MMLGNATPFPSFQKGRHNFKKGYQWQRDRLCSRLYGKRSTPMRANHHTWDFEIAERLRLDAARASEPDKRRILN